MLEKFLLNIVTAFSIRESPYGIQDYGLGTNQQPSYPRRKKLGRRSRDYRKHKASSLVEDVLKKRVE